MKIGITGHQRTPPSGTWDWVRSKITDILRQHAGPDGLAYTSLAAGADQEFAEAAVAEGVPLYIVLPCTGYENAFKDAAALGRFRALMASKPVRVDLLDFPAPSEDAYMAAGKKIVDSVDLLIAVWDGLPAGGNGGTDDTVAYAQSRKRRITHINPVTEQIAEL